MEKNGMKKPDLAFSIASYKLSRKQVEKTVEIALHVADTVKIKDSLISTRASKDIASMINAERLLIESDISDIKGSDTSKGTVTSLKTAEADLSQSLVLLDKVKRIDEYKSYNEGVSFKGVDRVNGLPRDAFHRFIDSNITRLNNSIISPKVSLYEKNILIERKSNMKIAKDEYMKLQAVALDIKLPEKNKERDRER